eukprot:11888671-Heterocapsa_arctica.AAC.1
MRDESNIPVYFSRRSQATSQRNHELAEVEQDQRDQSTPRQHSMTKRRGTGSLSGTPWIREVIVDNRRALLNKPDWLTPRSSACSFMEIVIRAPRTGRCRTVTFSAKDMINEYTP